jgi:glycosyltransferase involved in cell wall biosynthesis
MGLLDGVWLHATGEAEANDIRRHLFWADKIVVAQNVRRVEFKPDPVALDCASGRALRIVFLSRIDRKKNLDYALNVLRDMDITIEFDIYGPVSDGAYWRACQRMAAQMPGNVIVTYKGAIPNAAVAETLSKYDALLLPTAGENFGHAIFDALAVGLPVIISDRTPWCNLEEEHAGWSLPLDDAIGFSRALTTLKAMSVVEREILSRGARALAERSVRHADAVQRNRDMLFTAMQSAKR